MSKEFIIGGALLLIPAIILAAYELHAARKRKLARDAARRSKSRERGNMA